MTQNQFRRAPARARWIRSGATLVAGVSIVGALSACHTYRYQYEQKTGVGLTDRANDYCQRAAVKQGYSSVVQFGPDVVDNPNEVDVRMDVNDGSGVIVVSCSFDDKTRVAAMPRPQRNSDNSVGYARGDAKKARQVCDKAVRSSGYDARKTSTAEWNGGRQYRVNVAVRQGGADRNVACRYDGVAGTAVVPAVTK
jgi:hypothetical protein